MSFVFEPHPGAQTRFSKFKGRYALFGGAKGGGKSQCLLYDPFRQIIVEQDRVNRGDITASTGRAIFFRRTMPELREMISRSKRSFPLIDPGATWVEQAKTWKFSCGYEYVFGQMEEDGDWSKYYGIEFSEVIFDELTQFTEEQFDELDLCLRSTDPVLKTMLYMRAGTNPVGPGLPWVRERFVECAPPGTPVIRKVKTKLWDNGQVVGEKWVESEQIFIPARVEDNPSIDQAEYSALLSSKTPAMRRALLEGDWYVSESAFFADIWDPSVHICKPFKIPSGWYKFRSIDYGYVYPGMSSVQWWAVDPDGNMVCYRSYTCHGRNSSQLAQDIQIIERDNGEWNNRDHCSYISGPLDSSCWGDAGHVGPTIAETLMENGVHVFKCTKDRKGMADQMRIRLIKRSPHPTITDDKGEPAWIVPGIRWFDTCWNYVKTGVGKKVKVGPIITIPILPTDEDDYEKWDTDANDHDADSAGYACMSRPIMGEAERSVTDPQVLYEQRLWDDSDELAPRRASRTGYRNSW